MKIFHCAQGTTEWLKLRAGKPTASCFDSILTPGGKKNEPKRSAGWDRYMNHLLAERLLRAPIDGFKSQWMERGSELEHRAIASYELAHECDTERVGFVTTDDELIGCSPDRFVVDQPTKMVEAKAPTAAVHISYMRAAAGASDEYKVQLQGGLFVCEKEEIDIVSFFPGLPDVDFTVVRDDTFIQELEAHVRSFARQLDELTEEFRVKGWIKAPPVVEEVEQFAAFLNDADISWAMSREYQEQS